MDSNNRAINQRAFSADDAWSIGLEEAAQHGIKPHFKCLGEIKQKKGHFTTYLCAANHPYNQLSFLGGAAASPQLAKIKSFYEALEKNLSFHLYKSGKIQGLQPFSTATSPSTQFLCDKQLMPALLLQHHYQNTQYPWLELSHLQQADKKMYYPLSLIYPFVPQLENHKRDYLPELSNDTGLAIGATANEAIIHGINQWVERDAYSLFLLQTILPKNPKPARVIVSESLPENILTIVRALETHFAEKLIIIDMTSDIGIPAFTVSFTQQDMVLQPQGFGASLAKELALTQALFETLQYKQRFNETAQAYRQENCKYFSNYPLLLKAMVGDVNCLNEDHVIPVTWQSIFSYPLTADLKAQIHLMVQLLARKKINIYSQILYESSTGVAITYTLIPELENFGLIRDAKFLPIKKRGLGVLHGN